MSNPVVAVVAGTGLRQSWCDRILGPLARASQADHVVPLPRLGLGHLDTTYAAAAAQLQHLHLPGQPLTIVGWSQGALVGAVYAADKPNVHVISLGGPFDRIEGLWRLLAPVIPSVYDMSRGCSATDALRGKMPGLVDRLHSIYSLHDDVVGWRPSRLEGFPNHCVTAGDREAKRQMATGFHSAVYRLDERVNHRGLVIHPGVLEIVADIMADLPVVAAA